MLSCLLLRCQASDQGAAAGVNRWDVAEFTSDEDKAKFQKLMVCCQAFSLQSSTACTVYSVSDAYYIDVAMQFIQYAVAQGVKQMPTVARRPEDQPAGLQHPQPEIFASESLVSALLACKRLAQIDIRLQDFQQDHTVYEVLRRTLRRGYTAEGPERAGVAISGWRQEREQANCRLGDTLTVTC